MLAAMSYSKPTHFQENGTMKIDKLIAKKEKKEIAAEALDNLWDAIADHPRDGALLTLRCGGELRKHLLYAVYAEHERLTAEARSLDAELRAHQVARNG